MPTAPSDSPDGPPAARVRLVAGPPAASVSPHGPLRSTQEARFEVAPDVLERIWTPHYLERLARAYWRYLERISLGLLKVVYEPHARTVVLAVRPLALLRFRPPEYVTAPGLGQVTWPIERGVLVARRGRGQGYLRISVRRLEAEAEPALVQVRAEVANYYPFLRGGGIFARLGARLYSATQMRVHVLVMHGFLRSLARLELPPSRVAGSGGSPGERPQRDSI